MGDFRCSNCGGTKTSITDVRPTGAFKMRRRRKCECGHRFSTIEIPMEEYALLDIVDGSAVAKLHRDAKRIADTIDAIIRQRHQAEAR